MPLTRSEYDERANTHDEATARDHYSAGAWHMMLVQLVRSLGYDVRDYNSAKKKTQELLDEYHRIYFK